MEIVRVLRQPQAVSIQLDIGTPAPLGVGHDLRQIVPQGGLPAAELEKGSPRLADDIVDPAFHPLQGRVLGLGVVGKAEAAAQIAPAGDLQKGAAGVAQVLAAQAAVLRAAQTLLRPGLLPGAGPVLQSLAALPDQGGKGTVLRAGFLLVVPPAPLHPDRRNALQADGTDACSLIHAEDSSLTGFVSASRCRKIQ